MYGALATFPYWCGAKMQNFALTFTWLKRMCNADITANQIFSTGRVIENVSTSNVCPATFNAEALWSLLQAALGNVSKLPPKERSIRNWYCFHTSSFFR
jgi:uncharacterized membrane protein